MNTTLTRIGGCLLLASLAGCGVGKPTLDGTVTLDGAPLANGTVLLVKTDGGLVREGAVIKDGAFQVKLPAGKYRAEINARKVTGKQKVEGIGPTAEAEETSELIPEWYNSKSELAVEITPGHNEVRWDLHSKR
jgi:hypothetical protein